ncbi:aliphatic sulfonate ABC transporter substrate-binding protein [Derxia lacustris]|uniref:aliphatic sulfonate ABC transporter substrate-binding protein n=1 Tax=Derxia lacustris TaxID=764842 RepID=UPI000A171609|nr:aliphatic sulfonate ABC transporter substrate-binding protein [Derxia lacustris]
MTSFFRHDRRHALASLGALAGSALLPARGHAATGTLRIGYQKSSTLITVIKTRGSLDALLAPLGVTVSWHEFASGLPLLEALNLGNVDFSADVADTVPVFAQAAGADLTFVARETASPAAQAILVKGDSPLQTLADLKGKRVGFAKAAGAHYLLLAALQSVGLSFADITPAYLAPADGRAAFERGALDAWVVWDPFLAAAQRQAGARVLADGRNLASYQRYYLASTPYARAHGDVLQALFDELRRTGQWTKQNPKEAAALLSPAWGLDADTIEVANGRRSYDVQAVRPGSLDEQQRIADAFLAEKLLPKRVDASAVALFQPGKR